MDIEETMEMKIMKQVGVGLEKDIINVVQEKMTEAAAIGCGQDQE